MTPFARRLVPALALLATGFLSAEGVSAQEAVAPSTAQYAGTVVKEGDWKTSSGIIRPTRYPADFQFYDHVNPNAPKGGDLNLAGSGTFDSFNPFIVRGTPAAGFVPFGGGLGYDTLMEQSLDEPGVSHALIAEAIRFPSDFSSVSFRLNPAATWHDGTPITVEDVIWSFNTLTKTFPLWTSYYKNVVKAEKTGEREVTFRFDQAGNRELPNIMGDLTVLPKHYWEGKDSTGKARNIEEPTLEIPLGSGPYKVESFVPGDRIVWARVKDYWGNKHPLRVGRNNFDRIRYTYFRDQTAAFEAFKKGGIDDYRNENSAQKWSQGYDFPAVQRGDVIKTTYQSGGVEAFQGFVLNTRREKFADRRVRQALTLAFNFEEMNRTLFFGLYSRTTSYFQGSELAATGLPTEGELALLTPLQDKVPPEVFTQPPTLPDYGTPGSERTYLKQAFELLQAAGYERRGADLVSVKTGQPLLVQFLGADPNSTRVIEPYANQLRRLGIKVDIRIVDVSQYVALTNDFNYDIVTDVFAQTLSPGNEQRDFWGSSAAAQRGSRNAAGIRDAAVDALIDKIIYAPDRESLVAASRALDRVLLWSFYAVPQFHLKGNWLAYWNKFGMPEKRPEYAGIDTFSWWIKPTSGSTAVPAATPMQQ